MAKRKKKVCDSKKNNIGKAVDNISTNVSSAADSKPSSKAAAASIDSPADTAADTLAGNKKKPGKADIQSKAVITDNEASNDAYNNNVCEDTAVQADESDAPVKACVQADESEAADEACVQADESEAGNEAAVHTDDNDAGDEDADQTEKSEDDDKAVVQTDEYEAGDEAEALDKDDKTASSDEADNKVEIHTKRKRIIYKSLRILFTIGFFVFTGLFINEVFILPYRMNKSIEEAQALYNRPSKTTPSVNEVPTAIPDVPDNDDSQAGSNDESTGDENAIFEEPTPTPDPTRDSKGRLLAFSNLLSVNEDVKGWLTINNINGENDTKIDLIVMQSGRDEEDPEYYLYREWASREQLKSGSLILDVRSSVERKTRNLVIHGHNMKSTDSMFHHLVDYKEKDFLTEHPIINFDTIYETGEWKVFSVFITSGNDDKGDFFDYMRSSFKNDLDYLNFIYQLKIRSIYTIDDVDINENDQILTLSTCSYELRNYRTIVVARKVRKGEEPTINMENVTVKKKPLYPESYYKHYGGKPPKLSPNFESALENGEIAWYNPMSN